MDTENIEQVKLMGILSMKKDDFKRARLIMTGISILLIIIGGVMVLQDDGVYVELYGRHMTLEELFTKKVCFISPSNAPHYKKIVRAGEPCLNRTEVEMFMPLRYGSDYEEREFNHPSWKKNGSPLTSRPLIIGGNNASVSQ